ncbi:MAG: hypothetical protein Q7P63_14035 [Verrucomicrobiota bacterium JB022]|nr:hypothetical protein [Verrucomicrobiota bacterium JB022]
MRGLRSSLTPQLAAFGLLWGFFAGCAQSGGNQTVPMGSAKIRRVEPQREEVMVPPPAPPPPVSIVREPEVATPEPEPEPLVEAAPAPVPEPEPKPVVPLAVVIRIAAEEAPEPVADPIPVFPAHADLEALAGGRASFLLTVAPSGEVTGAELIETTHYGLIEPSRTALLQRRYDPEDLPPAEGQLVSYQLVATVVF